jgi:hypothetical protein
LIYADWLEDQGGAEPTARAHFIRIVPVHGSRVTVVHVRTRCRKIEPGLAAIGPQQLLTTVLRAGARCGLRLARACR